MCDKEEYKAAITCLVNDITDRLRRRIGADRTALESQMNNDLDTISEDIASEVSKLMGWKDHV